MQVVLDGEESLTVGALDAPGLEVSNAPGSDAHFSAFQMFAVSIGLCTASVLSGWAEGAGLDTMGLAVRLRWTLTERPRRLGALHLEVHWPGLPEAHAHAHP